MEPALSSAIVACLEEAYAAVLSDDQHVLPWRYRERLWRLIGPRRLPGEPPSLPHDRRTRLAAACAEKVLPIWKEHWPDADGPGKAIDAIPEALRDWANPDRHFEIMEGCVVQVEAVMLDCYWASRAGQSAVEALAAAIGDEEFEAAGAEVDEGDAQTDGPGQDAAGNAAVAYARGTTLHRTADPLARLEFWRWYLQEAVPSLFDVTPLKLG